MPVCWAAARFEGPLRDAVTAYKDEERRDVCGVLADGLAMSLATALAADPVLRRHWSGDARVLVVPMPSAGASRRRRGDDPVDALFLCRAHDLASDAPKSVDADTYCHDSFELQSN